MPVEANGLPHLDPLDRMAVEGVPGATKGSSRASGTYEAEEFGEDEVIVRFRGRRLRRPARYLPHGGEHWLVHRTEVAGVGWGAAA